MSEGEGPDKAVVPPWPDIYAEAFAVSLTPGGVTVTFRVAEPTAERRGGAASPLRTVGRVRLSQRGAQVLAEQLAQAAAAATTPDAGGPKH